MVRLREQEYDRNNKKSENIFTKFSPWQVPSSFSPEIKHGYFNKEYLKEAIIGLIYGRLLNNSCVTSGQLSENHLANCAKRKYSF